jgi:lysophospholipase L1-like esterase
VVIFVGDKMGPKGLHQTLMNTRSFCFTMAATIAFSTVVPCALQAAGEEEAAAKARLELQFHNDWANLERYRGENEQVPAPVRKEKRVVFMGDSITDCWPDLEPAFWENKAYLKRGIAGQTTPQMLVRFRADVVALRPRVVVILAGINDIAGNTGPSTQEMIQDNLASMVDIARANNIQVVLASLLPAFDLPWKGHEPCAEKIIRLNAWIKDYAERNDLVYLDYHSAMVDPRGGLRAEFTYDGVHPNREGYLVMAPLVQKAIKEALRK